MGKELKLSIGERYSIAVLAFFIPYILLELPSQVGLRKFGAAIWLSSSVLLWGVVMIAMGFVHNHHQLAGLRALLGVFEATLFPGCAYLISCWYIRRQVQVRLSIFYVTSVAISGLSAILAYGLAQLHGRAGLSGWRWIFIIEGIITAFVGLLGYLIIVDLPDKAKFLSEDAKQLILTRIQRDRSDAQHDALTFKKTARYALDIKLWVFALMFGASTTGSYALSYFLPSILAGMGFDTKFSQILVVSLAPLVTLVILFLQLMISGRLSLTSTLSFPPSRRDTCLTRHKFAQFGLSSTHSSQSWAWRCSRSCLAPWSLGATRVSFCAAVESTLTFPLSLAGARSASVNSRSVHTLPLSLSLLAALEESSRHSSSWRSRHPPTGSESGSRSPPTSSSLSRAPVSRASFPSGIGKQTQAKSCSRIIKGSATSCDMFLDVSQHTVGCHHFSLAASKNLFFSFSCLSALVQRHDFCLALPAETHGQIMILQWYMLASITGTVHFLHNLLRPLHHGFRPTQLYLNSPLYFFICDFAFQRGQDSPAEVHVVFAPRVSFAIR